MADTNFAFLNREDFLKHPACRDMFLYATQSERFFMNNEDLCAINARRFAELFIRFVSFELKKASYPEDCLCIGSYYSSGNKPEFYRVFGPNNAELIIQLNDATKPYFHPAMKKEDKLYRVVVHNIFTLSWWLYMQLYPGNGQKRPDFNRDCLPKDPGLLTEEVFKLPEEQKYKRISEYFPNCNTQMLYQVEHSKGQYIIKDLNGAVLNSVPDKKSYDETANEASRLWKMLEYMVDERDQLAEDFNKKQNSLISEIEAAKARLAEQDREISGLKDQYRIAGNKLADANNTITSLQTVIDDGSELAAAMRSQLDIKEQELNEARREAEKALAGLQAKYEEEKRIFDERYSTIEQRLTQVAAENYLFKKKLEEMDRSREVKDFLMAVDSGVSGMNRGYAVYAANKNEQELRSWLLKVKKYYEDQIEELREALKDREERLKKWEEEARKNAARQTVQYEPFASATPVRTENVQNKKRKNTPLMIILAVSAAVLLLLLGAYLMKLLSPETDGDEAEDDKYAAVSVDDENNEQENVDESDTDPESSDEEVTTEDPENKNEADPVTEEDIPEKTEQVSEPEIYDETEAEPEVTEETESEPAADDTDDNNRLPNVDDLYSNIQPRYEVADSILLIPGVNPELVSDIQHTNRDFFKKHYMTEEIINNHSDEMEYIGKFGMPVINTLNAYRDLSAWVGSYERLIRLKNAKVYKFVYHMGDMSEKFGDYVAAIMPEDFCEGIDNNSSLDDFIKILGSDPKEVGMRSGKTEMSTSENENGWLFQLKNYDGVLCFFDDEGKLCDYIYLYIAEGRDRELP